MKKYLLFTILCLVAPVAVARTIDEIPNVHLADSTRFMSDPDGYLSHETIARIDGMLRSVWRNSTAEPVAVIVKDMDGMDVDTYATELFEKWGVGKSDKSNGVLILASIDDRKAAIRTGYGAEGVLPDIIAGRILRNEMFPAFGEGDYDRGMTATVKAVTDILNDPQAADELMSKYANNADADDFDIDGKQALNIWLGIGAVVACLMLVVLLMRFFNGRTLERHDRYDRLNRLKLGYLVASIMFLGIPLPIYLALLLLMKKIRRTTPHCLNCQHKMRLIDEVHDNDFLTPAQDREEQLDSVDYDVWHCDNCGANEIFPYVNRNRQYNVCPNCGARTEVAVSNNVVRQPTTKQNGIGEKTYICKNCQNRRKQHYNIAKLAAPTVMIAPGIGRGGGGFGGGGFGGGSFGGGHTGGGGASGGW